MEGEFSVNISSPRHTRAAEQDMWTGLNEADVNDALTPPSMNELIHRAVSIFEKHLKHVIITRQAKLHEMTSFHVTNSIASSSNTPQPQSRGAFHDQSIAVVKSKYEVEDMKLDPLVSSELQDLISNIASKYNNVFFHNFEHAAHVMASADSLLSMLQSTTLKTNEQLESKTDKALYAYSTLVVEPRHRSEKKLSTYGIASCPITHLALVYSALVHDMGHEGIGNQQMVKENHPLAIKYQGKSVAENNSLDIAIYLLEQKNYANLRRAIFGDFTNASTEAREFMNAEEHIFYNILTENIHATDIFSRERLERNRRKWIESFDKMYNGKPLTDGCTCEPKSKILGRRASVPPTSKPSPVTNYLTRLRSPSVHGEEFSILCPSCQIYHDECVLRLDHMRACAVIVQMIQASDVAHSMQSWPIFLKWNMKLYQEFWAATLVGRGPDFSKTWFQDQIAFFDNYVTSVAKRLQQCGVFGDFGRLLLQNLRNNRARWLLEGEDLCEQMRIRIMAHQVDEIK
mmetsp:Transcript_12518/g.23499  ORF Transcript_12518/g.23499 Transcript_12518/m.23499 type:complete len:515 (+) Transcript_12518:237-1781(+)|eukprot:CAMPEP_0176483864 /NCGR_PEP_ID=MMETSP0200_2-20121128/4145_1 /TAXON_ID=947934 /ORGANISM="Chaetoceros sp., Strain GSL56" /LENGTH=514 /DNA_ID=CAMNT_0017880293 /DNA_START=153 /DNA_END=1697 /DNA_ORIENTATION=-